MASEGPWALSTNKLLHSQPHSQIPVSCEELSDESALLTKKLACNVSSPIFKAGREVSVGLLGGEGTGGWHTGMVYTAALHT